MANRQLYELTAKAGPTLVGADLLPIQITDGSVELAKVSLGDLFGNITSRVVLISPTNTYMDINSGANSVGNIAFQTNGSDRWYIQKNAAAESGANIGSDFVIFSKADDGLALRDDFFIKRDTGNVGIGTTNPRYKLDVNGAGQFMESDEVIDPGGAYKAVRIGYNTSGDYGWIIANNTGIYERNLILQPTNGNVGIGTTSPTSKLHVTGADDGTPLLNLDLATTSGILFQTKGFDDGLGQQGLVVRGSGHYEGMVEVVGQTFNPSQITFKVNFLGGSGIPFVIDSGANPLFRVLNTGNVGIGTTAPAAKLSVFMPNNSTANVVNIGDGTNGINILNGTSTGTYIPVLRGVTADATRAGLSLEGRILEENDIGTDAIMNFDARLTAGEVVNRSLFRWMSYGNEKMRITAAGNVGIGTTAPAEKLEVSGNIRVSNNIGIGLTATPDEGLHLEYNKTLKIGSDAVQSFTQLKMRVNVGSIVSTNHSWIFTSAFINRYGTLSLQARNDGNAGIAFLVGDGGGISEQMYLSPTGNLGIGTTAPTSKLHVSTGIRAGDGVTIPLILKCTNGSRGIQFEPFDSTSKIAELSVNSTSLAFRDDVDVIMLNMIYATRYVGIGVTSGAPSERLHVVGNVLATNFLLSSDMRDKTKVQDLSGGGDDFKYFTFTRDGEEGLRYGVSAQQVQEVAPELVREGNDGKLSVAYIDLLIREVARLSNEVKELKNRG